MQIKLSCRKTSYHCFEYLLAFALVLNCRSIWMSVPSMSWFSTGVLVLATMAVIGCIVCKKRVTVVRLYTGIAVMITLILWATLFLGIHHENASGWIRIVVSLEVLICFHIFCGNVSETLSILYKYENIISIICAVSLLFWIFGTMLGAVGSTGVIQSNWTGQKGVIATIKSYYGVYFETQTVNFLHFHLMTRNTAIFTEAPMCSFHFCLAFLIELFLKKSPQKNKLILLIIGVLTTLASSGYIIVVGSLFISFLMKQPRKKVYKLIRFFVVPLLLTVVGIIVIGLVGNKMQGTSGTTRVDDFIAGYKAWMNYPFFGNGYGNEDSYIQYMTASVRRNNNYGFSNSPMQILAYGGIYMAMPYVLSIIASINRFIRHRNWNLLAFEGGFLFLFTITIVSFQLITMYIFIVLFDGLSKSKKCQLKMNRVKQDI